ncbi:hypothetical protein J9303_01005 [Bacillaceae bacterium Marseille-Q3522]|nr:hypothetical protein [Bacillaceae bacterium Marseille-Q3522]
MKMSKFIFSKHAEKITKRVNGSWPALKGVLKDTDGAWYATDSHILLWANLGGPTENRIVVNPKTGETIDYTYPDVKRIIPKNSGETIFVATDVAALCASVKAYLSLAIITKTGERNLKKMDVVCRIKYPFGDRHFTIDDFANRDENAVARVQISSPYRPMKGEGFFQSFKPALLLDALELFKDAGINEITWSYYGESRPFLLNGENAGALILPFRELAGGNGG